MLSSSVPIVLGVAAREVSVSLGRRCSGAPSTHSGNMFFAHSCPLQVVGMAFGLWTHHPTTWISRLGPASCFAVEA